MHTAPTSVLSDKQRAELAFTARALRNPTVLMLFAAHLIADVEVATAILDGSRRIRQASDEMPTVVETTSTYFKAVWATVSQVMLGQPLEEASDHQAWRAAHQSQSSAPTRGWQAWRVTAALVVAVLAVNPTDAQMTEWLERAGHVARLYNARHIDRLELANVRAWQEELAEVVRGHISSGTRYTVPDIIAGIYAGLALRHDADLERLAQVLEQHVEPVVADPLVTALRR